MLNPGDVVKAFSKVGLQKKEQWNKGVVVSCDDNNVAVRLYNNQYDINRTNVKRFEQIDAAAVDAFANKNWDELKVVVRDAVAHFFPKFLPDLKENEETKSISVLDVEIVADITEVVSIAAFIEKPVWVVTYWKTTMGTRLDPPDVDAVDCGHSHANLGAAELFINTLWKLDSQGYWESKAYDACCKEDFCDY